MVLANHAVRSAPVPGRSGARTLPVEVSATTYPATKGKPSSAATTARISARSELWTLLRPGTGALRSNSSGLGKQKVETDNGQARAGFLSFSIL